MLVKNSQPFGKILRKPQGCKTFCLKVYAARDSYIGIVRVVFQVFQRRRFYILTTVSINWLFFLKQMRIFSAVSNLISSCFRYVRNDPLPTKYNLKNVFFSNTFPCFTLLWKTKAGFGGIGMNTPRRALQCSSVILRSVGKRFESNSSAVGFVCICDLPTTSLCDTAVYLSCSASVYLSLMRRCHQASD